MERLKHYTVRVLTAFSAFVFLLSLTTLIILNSGMLDQFVKERLISLFNEKFFGRLELQDLHLKFPNNVTLLHPRIYGPGEKTPALEAKTVSLKFNFLTILQPEIKRIYLRHLSLDSLSGKIIEEENGKFNLELVFASRDPDSTKRPLQYFFCKNLKIRKSSIYYSGNRKHPLSQPLALKDIDLDLSSLTVKKKFLKGTLDNLHLNIPRNNFSLRQASGKFLFSETRSEILALKAVSNKSNAELSATVEHFNIFSHQPLKELAHTTSFLNMQELAVHSDELKLLYPEIAIPPGIYTLKGNAKGKEDNVQILDALLTHLKSKIAVKGELLNLMNRNAFAYQLESDSSKITSTFLESLLKESSHKEIASKTGDITFRGRAKGNLKAVQTELTILSALGEASLNGEAAKAESEQLSGKGTFTLKGFKLHKLTGLSNAKSIINASGSFEGRMSKTEISQLALDMKLANSFWQNQQIKEGTISCNYEGKVLNALLSLKNNQTTLNIDSGIEWKDKTPRYHISGNTTQLDVSELLGSKEFKTDLNGLFSLQGSGLSSDLLNVTAVMQFSPSTINGFKLKERSRATAEIVQTAQSTRASITSDFLDLLAEGNYSLDDLVTIGKFTASGISREISAQNIWHSTLHAPFSQPGKLKKPFAINYHIAVKDISPLVLLFPVHNLTLQGSAEGQAISRQGQCLLNSSINLAKLQSYNDFLFENLSMKAEVECSDSGVPRASITGRASSITLAGKKTAETLFSGNYTHSRLDATLECALPDPAQNMSAKFSATKVGNSYELLFNHLWLKDNSGAWQAAENSMLMLDSSSMKFNHFTITKERQQAMFDGELSNVRSGNFQCTLSGIELNELKRFALNPSFDKLAGTINASLTVSGVPGSKTSSLRLNGQGIRYDKIMIGTLQGNAHHSGNQLRFELHSSVPGTSNVAAQAAPPTNTIEGSGTIPLQLSFYPLQFRSPEQQAVSASFRSDNLSARFLEYLLPFFESAEGIIPSTLRIEGSTPKPDIFLTTRLRDTKIKIEPTQVSYLLNGELYVTPKAVELRNLSISDNVEGTGKINGVITLEKLEPKELALEGRFEKLLLFNKKDKKDETSFGTITGTTDNILLHGNFSAPVVEGELRVNAADFSLYRKGANESAKYLGVDKFIEFAARYPSRSAPGIEHNEKSNKRTEFYYSLIDIVQIKELRLSSVEPLRYTVIFDRLRGEQLETSINNLSLIVGKHNQQFQLFGSVNVIGGKYKFSNSNFDLQDGGKITWNNIDIRNGVMDNLYGSKYVSASNQQTGERDNVKLLLAITGTLNEPQVAMGYFLNEQTQPYASVNMIGNQTSQIDPNAELNVISMLLSRQWYVRPGSNGQNANIAVSSVGFSAGTGIVSSRISKVIQDIAGLESFNVNVGMDKRGALSGLDLYFALNVPGTDGKVRFIGTGSSPSLQESALSNYYGTAQKIEYRVTPKVFLEASRSYGQSGNATSSTNLQKPSETWGVSLSYRERFHTWDQFWKRLLPSSSGNKK